MVSTTFCSSSFQLPSSRISCSLENIRAPVGHTPMQLPQYTHADSGSATYTATYTETTPPPSGLVAAYGFDEASGATVVDASGTGNTGTITGASRTTGKYGGALSFNGTSNWVTVPDAASLDLTKFTISAWVKPATVQSAWRTAVLKEKPGGLVYALYANGVSPSAPSVWIDPGTEVGTGTGPSALPACGREPSG